LSYYQTTYQVNNLTPDSRPLKQQHALLVGEKIKNPNTKKEADRTDVRTFSLMLSTKLGVIDDESNKVRMRPETAQAMFVNFKNVIDTTRARLPFGLAQVGKAFRNEITPGNFLFRTREFEQMEIQMFLTPELSDTRYTKFQEMSREFREKRI
jgi:glycyl-tRNA synthetase